MLHKNAWQVMSHLSHVSCVRLPLSSQEVVFVKGNWFADHFSLAVIDGQDAWRLEASEEQVACRADQWDKSVSDYLDICRKHLGQQCAGCEYEFIEEVDGWSKLSFETKDEQGTTLKVNWRLQKDADPGPVALDILNCIVDRNEALEEIAVKAKRDFERMEEAAQKALAQAEQFKEAKKRFEDDIYKKFVAVLNSKKAKLRELRDALASRSKVWGTSKVELTHKEKEEPGYHTESEDGSSGSGLGDEEGGSPVVTNQLLYSDTRDVKPEMQLNDGDAQHWQPPDTGQQNLSAPGCERLISTSSRADAGSAAASDVAAALLSTASDYTSAPRRRRMR